MVPAEARKDFGIKQGDKLLVFGDMKTGMWIATFGILEKQFKGMADLFRNLESSEREPRAE